MTMSTSALRLRHAPRRLVQGRHQLPDGEQFQPGNVYMDGGSLRFDSEVANTGRSALELAVPVAHGGTPGQPDQVIFHRNGSDPADPDSRLVRAFDQRGDHNHRT